MIEWALLFGMGFCAATLLAILCLPLVWRRALRLAKRRLARLVPLSEAEIMAARDGLRADAAITQRQLEQQRDQARDAAAADNVALGHRTVALVETGKRLAERETELGRLTDDWNDVKAALVDSEAQRAALLLDLDHLTLELDSAAERHHALQAQHETLSMQAERQGSTIAGFETQTGSLQARLADLGAELKRRRADQAELWTTQSALERERDAARDEIVSLTKKSAMLDQRLRDAVADMAEQTVRLQAKKEALARAERTIMEKTEDMADAVAAMADLRQRFDALRLRLRETGSARLGPAELDDLRSAVTEVGDRALATLRDPNEAGRDVPRS